jgi:NAD(P)H-dependent FMN reductase
MSNVLFLVGSLRAGSFNRQIAEVALEQAPAAGHNASIYEIGELPFYNEDIDTPEQAGDAVAAFRKAAADADAIVLFSPEYNGTTSGVLKNAVDWLSRPRGSAAMSGKTVAVVTASPSPNAAKWAGEEVTRALGVAGATSIAEPVNIGDVFGKFGQGHARDHAETVDAVVGVLRSLGDVPAGATA